jgi:hypothetical protein
MLSHLLLLEISAEFLLARETTTSRMLRVSDDVMASKMIARSTSSQ